MIDYNAMQLEERFKFLTDDKQNNRNLYDYIIIWKNLTLQLIS